MLKKISFILLIAITLFGKNYKKEFDKILKEDFTDHTPSMSIAVISNDKIIYKKAFGMASLELNVPATTKSVYRIGSLSKQITAACIVMLEQDGKLKATDKIIDYFPELPADIYGEITIEQMIFHTSGIRDSENMYALMGITFSQWYTHDMMMDMLKRQKGLCFEPGTDYEYSNSAYTLLALIVEKVTGQTFTDFAEKNIFQPLGMDHTVIQSTDMTFIQDRTAGYKLVDGQYVNWMTNNQLVGHDAVYSSVEDMFLWQQAVLKGKIGNYDLSIMNVPGKFNDGSDGNYGYGLVMGNYKGLPHYCHDGWYVGYKAFIITFPEQDFAVIALSNLGNRSPRPYAFKIIDLYLDEYLDKTALKPITESELFAKIADTEKFVRTKLGNFKSLESIKKDYFISPWDDSEFCSSDYLTRLKIIEKDQSVRIKQFTSYGSRHTFIPYNEIILSETRQAELSGNYYSPELETAASVYLQDGKLRITVGLTDQEIFCFDTDQFAGKEALVKIRRDESGKLTGFSYSTYSVRGIEFFKKCNKSKK